MWDGARSFLGHERCIIHRPLLCVGGGSQGGGMRKTIILGCFESRERSTYVDWNYSAGDALPSLGITLEQLCSFCVSQKHQQRPFMGGNVKMNFFSFITLIWDFSVMQDLLGKLISPPVQKSGREQMRSGGLLYLSDFFTDYGCVERICPVLCQNDFY